MRTTFRGAPQGRDRSKVFASHSAMLYLIAVLSPIDSYIPQKNPFWAQFAGSKTKKLENKTDFPEGQMMNKLSLSEKMLTNFYG